MAEEDSSSSKNILAEQSFHFVISALLLKQQEGIPLTRKKSPRNTNLSSFLKSLQSPHLQGHRKMQYIKSQLTNVFSKCCEMMLGYFPLLCVH